MAVTSVVWAADRCDVGDTLNGVAYISPVLLAYSSGQFDIMTDSRHFAIAKYTDEHSHALKNQCGYTDRIFWRSKIPKYWRPMVALRTWRFAIILVRAFPTYVRPLIEYNSVVWSPYLKSDIELIENVQRRFTKRLKGFSELSYDDRLKLLNLERLEIRRHRFGLLCCYKIIFGLVRIDREAFFELRASCTRGHPYKLFKHHSRVSVRSNFFAERVINAWNGLPADHIDFSSFPKFQRSLQHCFNC